jgi:DNA invertase Pin-like site-specific DNA recombinase
MRRYCRHRGWELALEIQEVGSGADRDRVKRAELMASARKKQIDVVVVWKLDRWGRSLLDLIHTLQELESLGTGFVSITEALDLTTPTGRAMAGMLGVFAEFEREMLQERIKAGIKQARKNGKHCGRPPSALLKTNEVLTLYRKKTSLRQISKELGMSRSSARRILCLEGVIREKR